MVSTQAPEVVEKTMFRSPTVFVKSVCPQRTGGNVSSGLVWPMQIGPRHESELLEVAGLESVTVFGSSYVMSPIDGAGCVGRDWLAEFTRRFNFANDGYEGS